MFKGKITVMAGIGAAVLMIGAVGALVSNTRTMRRRRFFKKLLHGAEKACCAMHNMIRI